MNMNISVNTIAWVMLAVAVVMWVCNIIVDKKHEKVMADKIRLMDRICQEMKVIDCKLEALRDEIEVMRNGI